MPLAERWKQGWIDPTAPDEITTWPNASDVASAFGSFTSFCDAVRIEYAARLSDDALRVIDVPKERQALALLTAVFPAAPDEVERVDVDAQALTTDGLAMLLAARGEIELADLADECGRSHQATAM